MKKLMSLLHAVFGCTPTAAPKQEEKGQRRDDFVVEAAQFSPVSYSGVPGLWHLEHAIDVVFEDGKLWKCTMITTAECLLFQGGPKACIIGKGWVERSKCALPLPEDIFHADDLRPAHIVRETFAAA